MTFICDHFYTVDYDFVMYMETKLQLLMLCVYTMHYEFGLTITLKKKHYATTNSRQAIYSSINLYQG